MHRQAERVRQLRRRRSRGQRLVDQALPVREGGAPRGSRRWAGRWPKARPFIHVPLFSVPGCHPGLKHSQDVEVVIAGCVSRAWLRPCRASTVACGVRTSM